MTEDTKKKQSIFPRRPSCDKVMVAVYRYKKTAGKSRKWHKIGCCCEECKEFVWV